MKKKMRELVIAAMLVVMASALCITLISCGSSDCVLHEENMKIKSN